MALTQEELAVLKLDIIYRERCKDVLFLWIEKIKLKIGNSGIVYSGLCIVKLTSNFLL